MATKSKMVDTEAMGTATHAIDISSTVRGIMKTVLEVSKKNGHFSRMCFGKGAE